MHPVPSGASRHLVVPPATRLIRSTPKRPPHLESRMRIMIVLSLCTVIASGLAAQQKEVLKVPGAVAGLPFSPM